MNWLLVLVLLCGCSHPLRDVSCLGEAPYSMADPWESQCNGWKQCPIDESDGVTADDFSKEKTLTELINLALRTNPTTKKYWAQARADAYAYEQSKALFYPQVNLYGAFDQINQNYFGNAQVATNLRSYKTWTNEMNISWLLFDFGGREFNMMAFKMALFSSNWAHTQAIQNVMNAVLVTYYAFLESQALVKAKEQDLKDSQVNVEVAKVRFDAGLGTKVDVLQAQSTLANTELSLESLLGQVKINLGQLAVALGLPANSKIVTQDLPTKLPLLKTTKSLDQLVEIARTHRGDLNQAQAQYQQQYYNYQTSLAQFWPTISVNYLGEKINYSKSPISRYQDSDFTLNIDFPIFTGFNDYYRTKVNRERTYQAWAAWAEKEAFVSLDVLTAYYNVEVAEQTLKFSEEFLNFAEKAYELTLESYKVGVSSYTDLLTSQSQLSTARSTRIVSLTQYISSLSSLAYAAGILAVSDEGIDLKSDLESPHKEEETLTPKNEALIQ